MGQYWVAVNLDKKEKIDARKLGCGLKLWEQVANQNPGAALIILCAALREERGGGDLSLDSSVAKRTIGRWAGDRIALVGDYAKDTDLAPEHEASKIYEAEWTDISEDVLRVIEDELADDPRVVSRA